MNYVNCEKCKKNIQTDNTKNTYQDNYLSTHFKCPYCRTFNVTVKQENNINNKNENVKVKVNIHENMSSGPTIDYLRENGMPDWIKNN